MRHSGYPFARWITAAAALVLGLALPAAQAQDYPARPVTMVVPFPAGTGTDNLIRPVALELQKLLGQPVVIDNRGGAQGVIGAQYVAQAKPDGYTLLVGSVTTLAANVGLFKTLPFDPVRDFQPVAGVASTSMMFLVRADSPNKDLKTLLATARQQQTPVPVAYASSSGQVALALLSRAMGVKFTPVPYKGSPQAVNDLIGGVVPVAVVDIGSGLPQVRAGKLAALATTGNARSASAPDVPTLSESYPGSGLVTWIGVVAPTGTPKPVVDHLYEAFAKVLAMPATKEKFGSMSFDVETVAPAELGKRMQADQAHWIGLIRAAGIQPE